MNLKKMQKKIGKYEYVSFDIFDTLLKRNVESTYDIFEFVEYEYNKFEYKNKITGFKEKRIRAEKKAIEELKKESVTIDEIYEKIEFKKEIIEKLKKLELKIEFNIIQKNNYIYNIYKFCKENNKKIIAISDMYIDGSNLKKLLEKNDIFVEKCFSSSDYNATKSSGKLYKKVLKDLNIKPNQIIHIGDSLKSDFIQAKRNKINAIKIKDNKKIENKSKPLKDNIAYNATKVFIKNNIKEDDYYYNIGFSKFGILLYGFCEWLNKEVTKENIKNIYFLSRDGYIIKKAYDILYPEKNKKSKYLYISRRAIRVPTLFLDSEFENLNDNINMSNNFNITTFIKRLGLNKSDVEQFITPEIDKEFSKEMFFKDANIKNFYEKIKKIVVENSKKEYELFDEYLKQELEEGRIAIVDIGWEGTIQKNLNKFITNNEIYGYYFGIHNEIKKKTQGYLFDKQNGNEEKNIISASYGLFETLFLANEGSVKKYKKVANKIEPILEKYEFLDKNNNEINEIKYVKSVQNGALDFIKKYKEIIYINNFIDNPKIYFEELSQLLINPTNEDIDKLKDIIFNDTINVKLIENRSRLKYLNLKLLKKDFFESVWKIGFLKKIIKMKFPYFIFYKKIRGVYKKEKNGEN